MIDNFKILTRTFADAHLNALTDYQLLPDSASNDQAKLITLKTYLGVKELYYLSTCNRVLYLFYSSIPIEDLNESLTRFLRCQSKYKEIDLSLNSFSGEDAVRHFFEVASSLKSMVVGEHEILRQVKEAYNRCWSEGLAGDQIRILFQSALKTAKAVHQKTRISEKTVSVVSLAMKKLRQLGIHQDDEVILIGAGTTMQKVAMFLQEWGIKKVKVFNRSQPNMERIRQILPEVETHPLNELNQFNIDVPFIITCTGHMGYLLTTDLIDQSKATNGMTNNRGVLDLAIPRDVHPELVTKFGLKVIEVESLRSVAEKNRAFRMAEASAARNILNEEIDSFREKVHRRFIERAFQEIPSMIYATRDKALYEVYKDEIENLDEDGQKLVREIVEYMARKCISIPMKTARKQYSVIRKEMTQLATVKEQTSKS